MLEIGEFLLAVKKFACENFWLRFAAGGDRSKFGEIGKSLRKLKGEICGWEMQLSLGEIRKRLQRCGKFEIKRVGF